MRAKLIRIVDTGRQTLGEIQVGEFSCFSLELPWKDNHRQISCIPAGIYTVRKFNSPKFGLCYAVDNVPNRSQVRIHAGTYFKHTLGCILPGTDQKDLNRDGELDNISSKHALAALLELDITEIEINYRP